jgi:hypothetical protein
MQKSELPTNDFLGNSALAAAIEPGTLRGPRRYSGFAFWLQLRLSSSFPMPELRGGD